MPSLEPAPGRLGRRGLRGVDPNRSGPDGAGGPEGLADVPGPDGGGQAVLGVVGLAGHLGHVVEREHGGHGAEDLLPGDAEVLGVGLEDRGRDEVPTGQGRIGRTLALVGQAGPLGGARVDVALDPVPLLGGDQGAHGDLGIEARADADPLGLVHEPGQHLVVDGPLDEDAAARGADLALVAEDAQALPATAAARSASANTMLGLLPPSSSVTRFRESAQVRMMC